MTGDVRTVSSAPATDAVAPILTAVLDGVDDALAVLAEDGEVRYANAAFRKLVSDSTGPVVGVPLDSMARLTPPVELRELGSPASGPAWDGWLVPSGAPSLEPAPGPGRPASLRPLPLGSGPAALLLAVPGGSGHGACRAEVRKAEGAGRMARAAVHEMNNVLAAITTFTELLLATRTEAEGGDRDREDLEEIRTAARRGAEITRALAAFRTEGALPAETVDVGSVLRGHRGVIRRLVPADVDLVWDLPPSGPWVRIDPRALDRLVVNLALDLGEAPTRSGTLRFGTARMNLGAPRRVHDGMLPPAAWIALEIEGADTESVLPALAGSARTAGVWVEGDAGTLRLFLPAEELAHRGAAPGAAGVGSSPEPATVLLVELDAGLRAGLRRTLAMEGFRVLDAADGAEAVALVTTGGLRPDVVLAEVVAPAPSGADLARALRTSGVDPSMVFFTGRGDHPRVAALRRSGVSVLDKPVPTARLLRELQEAVDAGRTPS